MSESKDLAKKIVSFLTAEGWTVWQNNSGKIKTGSYCVRLSPEGYGDIIGHTGDGRFVNIEVKVGKDQLRQKQIEVLYDLTKAKYAISVVARDWDQFRAWFSEQSIKGF